MDVEPPVHRGVHVVAAGTRRALSPRTIRGALAAYVVQALGILLTIRASSRLDVLDLSGVRALLRLQPHSAAPRHIPLETTGLYGFVRHPLYFAWTCFVFGAPDMTATRFVFALVKHSLSGARDPV